MRLLHVSDWHIGTTLGRLSRAPDHAQVLEETIEAAEAFRPHLIVHSGDLYDHTRPAVEALRQGMDALQRLSRVAPVVVVAGNHDSPAMFELFDQLVGLVDASARGRVRFVARARRPADGGVLHLPGDTSGAVEETVRLAPLPFVHPNQVVDLLDEPPGGWPADYADKVKLLEAALGHGLADGFDPNREIALFAAHLHVGGATWSKSERPLHVSDSYATHPEHIPVVSYAAFGHIHKPQPLPGTAAGTYAGSPIPIDFGEEHEQKSVVAVEIRPGRAAKVTRVPLSGGRRLRRVAGSLDELAARAHEIGEAIVLATVDTAEPTPDLVDKVAAVLPRATLLDVQERCAATRVEVVAGQGADEPETNVRDLLREYLADNEVRGVAVDRVFSAFDTLLDAVSTEAKPDFAEAALLHEDADKSQEVA